LVAAGEWFPFSGKQFDYFLLVGVWHTDRNLIFTSSS
jgi:hypothetical protein